MRIPNPYFENVPQIGNLIMDYILIDYDYPLLFVCRTDQYRLYLCDCCDTYKEQKWLIASITEQQLIRLIDNEITIRDAFIRSKGNCCIAVWSQDSDTEHYVVDSAAIFSEEDLPEKGAFLDGEDGEYDDYRKVLWNRMLLRNMKMNPRRIESVPEKDYGVSAELVNRSLQRAVYQQDRRIVFSSESVTVSCTHIKDAVPEIQLKVTGKTNSILAA